MRPENPSMMAAGEKVLPLPCSYTPKSWHTLFPLIWQTWRKHPTAWPWPLTNPSSTHLLFLPWPFSRFVWFPVKRKHRYHLQHPRPLSPLPLLKKLLHLLPSLPPQPISVWPAGRKKASICPGRSLKKQTVRKYTVRPKRTPDTAESPFAPRALLPIPTQWLTATQDIITKYVLSAPSIAKSCWVLLPLREVSVPGPCVNQPYKSKKNRREVPDFFRSD